MSDITRSEAIKQLRLLKADITHGLAFISKTKDKHPALESLDMAIASLETDEAYQLEYESTTKNDLGVEKIVDVLGSYTDLDIPYKREIAENILTKLSSVTPQEPKTGHWIMHEKHRECSECGVYLLKDMPRNSYCPNCGCRMVEPQESEDKE